MLRVLPMYPPEKEEFGGLIRSAGGVVVMAAKDDRHGRLRLEMVAGRYYLTVTPKGRKAEDALHITAKMPAPGRDRAGLDPLLAPPAAFFPVSGWRWLAFCGVSCRTGAITTAAYVPAVAKDSFAIE